MKTEPLSLSSEKTPAIKKSKIDFKAWFDALGLHGKLLAGGALLGVICAFLPLVSVSAGGVSFSAMNVECWQGFMSLVAYIAIGAAAWLLYQSEKHRLNKQFLYSMLGAAGLIVLFALWMALAARRAIGFGAILNLLAAASVGVGAFLKAKEEKVF